ncbi:MAG TPA: nitroreductase family deazaflavin-dependent oxidoreductase [Acidimicrobiales bacterium]|jgi:deazaflavin-dependent oxidoreductase (nitroreductase family)|nr:nitroreductase family deazaflavin-dependent oxidoreductase [Acidimicrobiales bacterium]
MLLSRLTVAFDRILGRRSYRIHRFLYRLTRGIIGHRTPLGPMLLLTTTGRRTGEARTSPLLYMPDGGDVLVVGSNGGRDRPPAWVLNLTATPAVSVQVGRDRFSALAIVLGDAEKAAMWPRLAHHYKGWSYYQTITQRELAVVLLARVHENALAGNVLVAHGR